MTEAEFEKIGPDLDSFFLDYRSEETRSDSWWQRYFEAIQHLEVWKVKRCVAVLKQRQSKIPYPSDVIRVHDELFPRPRNTDEIDKAELNALRDMYHLYRGVFLSLPKAEQEDIMRTVADQFPEIDENHDYLVGDTTSPGPILQLMSSGYVLETKKRYNVIHGEIFPRAGYQPHTSTEDQQDADSRISSETPSPIYSDDDIPF